jgi:hypothetical protein
MSTPQNQRISCIATEPQLKYRWIAGGRLRGSLSTLSCKYVILYTLINTTVIATLNQAPQYEGIQGSGGILNILLTSGLDGGGRLLQRPGRFTSTFEAQYRAVLNIRI